jgi:cell shape-determining protein MreC
MDRGKNITLILVIVTIISLLLAATFSTKRKTELEKRLGLEVQLNKLTSQKEALEASLKETIAKLEEVQMTNENLKTALAQEQLKNQSLTTELEKMNQVKSALEEKLSQASISAPAASNQAARKKK